MEYGPFQAEHKKTPIGEPKDVFKVISFYRSEELEFNAKRNTTVNDVVLERINRVESEETTNVRRERYVAA